MQGVVLIGNMCRNIKSYRPWIFNQRKCFGEVSPIRCGDIIHVLWIMDHLLGRPVMWFDASVFHFQEHSLKSTVGYGVTLYTKGDESGNEIH